jgi:hypothetical protein
VLIGSAVVAERFNIIYSGRVKSYVIDALIVLGLAVIIPRLARHQWHWRMTLAWTAGALLVGLFSPFARVATFVGGVLLLVRPSDDLGYRIVDVGAQAFASGILTLAVRRTYDVNALQRWWRDTYDGFVVSHHGPVGVISQAFVHLRRVTEVFSGGPSWWLRCALSSSSAR